MSFNNTALTFSLIAFALGGAGCSKTETKKGPDVAQQAVVVKAVPSETVTVPVQVEATGTVRARVTSVLSARLMGHIQEIRVQAGDTVRAGQTVAIVDAREAETGYRQAEAAQAEARSALPEANQGVVAAKAQLDLADATLRRMTNLHETKSISDQEYDEARAKRELAKAQHEMALARQKQVAARISQTQEAVATAGLQSGYAEVKAPFNGIVIERKAEPGMLASPGMPLVVVEQTGSYRLEVAVEESMLPKVKPGQKVSVTLDAFDRQMDGRVSEIVPALDPGSRSFVAKIDLPAVPNLRSGVFGRARFETGKHDVVMVSASAVVQDGQVQRVFVVEGGVARGRLVTVGAARGGRVEVLSGLRPGEMLVAPVPTGLADGARVEVRP